MKDIKINKIIKNHGGIIFLVLISLLLLLVDYIGIVILSLSVILSPIVFLITIVILSPFIIMGMVKYKIYKARRKYGLL